MQYVPYAPPVVLESRRDCIVVSGKKYCENADLTSKQSALLTGSMLLIAVVCGAYIITVIERDWNAWLAFGVPIAMVILSLLAYGLL